MYLSKWEINLDNINLAKLKEITRYLKAANNTRSFLTTVGIPVIADSTLTKIFKNAKMVAATDAKASSSIAAQQIEFHAQLKSLID